jgi:hypothetical protein
MTTKEKRNSAYTDAIMYLEALVIILQGTKENDKDNKTNIKFLLDIQTKIGDLIHNLQKLD